MRLLVALASVALALSGCLAAPEPPSADAAPPAWPDPDAAPIRPGVQVARLGPLGEATGVSGCTANFVFASSDLARLFLSTAAHCVEGLALGDAVWIAGETARGRLAYSSWLAMREAGEGEPTASAPHPNDFALLEISGSDRALVHPAVLGLGGPRGLAASGESAAGDALVAYGNSSLKPEAREARLASGHLVSIVDDYFAHARFDVPLLPADSGSPVLTDDGLAWGVLVTLETDAHAEAPLNGVSRLDALLTYAREHGAPDVTLATWSA